MANHESAKKAYRRSLTRNKINNNRKSSIKTLGKKLSVLINNQHLEESQALFKSFQSLVMKGVTKKVFKFNTASRKVAKMSQSILLLTRSKESK